MESEGKEMLSVGGGNPKPANKPPYYCCHTLFVGLKSYKISSSEVLKFYYLKKNPL